VGKEMPFGTMVVFLVASSGTIVPCSPACPGMSTGAPSGRRSAAPPGSSRSRTPRTPQWAGLASIVRYSRD